MHDERPLQILPDRSDVFVVSRDAWRAGQPQAPSAGRPDGRAAFSPAPPLVQSLLSGAVTAHKAKRYAHSAALYGQVLAFAPADKAALLGRSLASLAEERWSEAAQSLRTALAQPQHARDPLLHARLGDALLGSGQAREALQCYEAAAACMPAASPSEACVPPALADLPGAAPLNRVGLALSVARAQYATGAAAEQQAAASAVMAVLALDEHNFDALYEYFCIAADRGMVEDAVRVGLRLITAQPAHRGVRRRFAECVLAPSGLACLVQGERPCAHPSCLFEIFPIPHRPPPTPPSPFLPAELGSAINSAPALGFLATALREYGAVIPAAALCQRAVAAAPESAAAALSLVHALELLAEHDAAITVRPPKNELAGASRGGWGGSLGGGRHLAGGDLPLVFSRPPFLAIVSRLR